MTLAEASRRLLDSPESFDPISRAPLDSTVVILVGQNNRPPLAWLWWFTLGRYVWGIGWVSVGPVQANHRLEPTGWAPYEASAEAARVESAA